MRGNILMITDQVQRYKTKDGDINERKEKHVDDDFERVSRDEKLLQ